MDRIFPLYSYDGELQQWINQKRFRRLEAAGRIARVIRNRTGEVKRATLLRLPSEPKPSMLSDYRGTSYSFRQRLAEGHRCHRLRALGDKPRADEYNLAPDAVRPIFLAVLPGCLVTA
jgi:hypothetical protein